ncbi:hypothetical protein [Clostridium sp.]|uniref:hypothetical protein n=1 Tax=Clostridium sp. TaxID=1506 RepID=UPI0026395357|nr:hypothetical protein [Clostridium sp.]
MRLKRIMLLLALSISLVGCHKEKAVDLPMEKEPSVEAVVKDNTVKEVVQNNSDMKNIVYDKYKIDIVDNSDNIINLDIRNSTMVQKYSEAIKLVKDFCINNSLEIIFVEPIEHRISRMSYKDNIPELLQSLKEAGAETVSYFTDEDILNVELGIIGGEDNFSEITYKASIANGDQKFNFKGSKLNEFRNILVETKDVDFDKINQYIQDIYDKNINKDMVFFNKIDDGYEVIRIENNNCYYKLVYNPKL